MNGVTWATQQIELGNSVRRASIPTVYLKKSAGIVPWPITAIFSTADDSLMYGGTYVFDLDDCAATDWELVP